MAPNARKRYGSFPELIVRLPIVPLSIVRPKEQWARIPPFPMPRTFSHARAHPFRTIPALQAPHSSLSLPGSRAARSAPTLPVPSSAMLRADACPFIPPR
ncbi:hypothetical protein C8Q73DRAFT_674650 [Cubamyces lactineus]|nr:hypothetical protein C8Q73DRAFT_674638 [Cubamyces lactineus]KAH9903428.1 hypothetical protein C8Q73DRAFT_674650 [Cubamyces lactineus]